MSITTETMFGPYRVIEKIGAGGMGEVYRAVDTRLDRTVALKVLLSSVGADADRLRRFEQEAKTLAALNHPNILAVHDLGTQDGVAYLVSEYLEGETLRDKLASGPLPVRKSTEYALGIAHGLAAGHSKGIVHRDIKPENIFLTADGRTKILDFGLAKLAQPTGADSSGINDTLLTSNATQPGLVLGTVGYMSPEQVRGEPAEATSDIFSLGAVLYEMLSGKRAFKCDTAAETMTAVLRENPPDLATETPSGRQAVPAGLQRILDRCLEKQPRQRFQSASDLAFAIESLGGSSTSGVANSSVAASALSSSSVSAMAGVVPPRTKSWLWPALVFSAAAIAAAGWFAGKKMTAKPVPIFSDITYRRGTIPLARFTRDGQTILYSARFEGEPLQIYSLRIDLRKSVKVPMPSATLFAVSQQDNMAVGLDAVHASRFLTGTLAEVAATGGEPRPKLEGVISADYLPDGSRLAVTRFADGKCRVEFPLGTKVYESSGYLDYVRVSPDGKSVAFVEHPVKGDDRGWLSYIDAAGTVHRLTPEELSLEGAVWAKDGERLWFSAEMNQDTTDGYQLGEVDLKGTVQTVLSSPSGWAILQDISADGKFLIDTSDKYETISAGDATGKETPHLELFDSSTLSDISPDGKAILFFETDFGEYYQVVYRKTDGSPPIELGEGGDPKFSPDGKIAAAVKFSQPQQLLLYPIGTGETRSFSLGKLAMSRRSISWFPNGKHLAVVGSMADSPERTYDLDFATGRLQPLGPVGFLARAIAADGNRIAGNTASGAVIWNLATNQTTPIAGIAPQEIINGWSLDGMGLVLTQDSPGISTGTFLALATGQRTLLRTVDAKDKSATLIGRLQMADDKKSYAYWGQTANDELWVVDGVR